MHTTPRGRERRQGPRDRHADWRADADLLAVLETSPLPFLDRSALLARYFEGVGVGCDVLAYTRAELESLRQEGAALPRRVETEGRVLGRRVLPER